jgi:hypothetical protein
MSTPAPAADRPSAHRVLTGPLLRRLEPSRMVLWLVADAPLALRLCIRTTTDPGRAWDIRLAGDAYRVLPIGRRAFVHLLDVQLAPELPVGVPLHYDLLIATPGAGDSRWRGVRDWGPELVYPGAAGVEVMVHDRLEALLHGSCRKPHHPAPDGLAAAEKWFARHRHGAERPALLMLTGDQIYADDVAGPMLAAIHRVIERYGLLPETLAGATVADSDALYASPDGYYHREALLPRTRETRLLRERFFGGVAKPIFTTANAQNHLVTLAEVLAMYLLVWSPEPWRGLCLEPPELGAEERERYAQERERIEAFAATLPAVRRLLAHLPTYMIFDDHDVTDDWNLTAGWELSAYQHPFSRRIVGNALIGYLLCQGWGNDPDAFRGGLLAELSAFLDAPDGATQDELIHTLLAFEGWHYRIPTRPKVMVVDNRTRRWRSERSLNRPSGLMDWEALSELQQGLIGEDAVVLVSPAPVFGVKLIEAVQRVFTWLGQPLLVDAENWMAHPGAANVILNIFRHRRTPRHFVILSGDVHYSFVYDVELRGSRAGPAIWQVTSSGIKNEFPRRLLDWFDRLNRWLYAPRSPLNWLTRRRRLKIRPRRPDGASRGERLVNRAGIGYLRLDAEGRLAEACQITVDGAELAFHEDRPRTGRSDRWEG